MTRHFQLQNLRLFRGRCFNRWGLRLSDGLLEAKARRIAFDVVFAYAGADFQVGSFVLPDYDRSFIDSLSTARERIILGRFPSVPPAPPFLRAVGASRVGVLDLHLESDGRVPSTAPLIRLADGRIALGFAALAAGLSVRQASAAERILIAPYAPMTDTPTYSLATLLDCLSSEEGLEQVRLSAADQRRCVHIRRHLAPDGLSHTLYISALQPSLAFDQSAIELCSEAEPLAAICPQHGS